MGQVVFFSGVQAFERGVDRARNCALDQFQCKGTIRTVV